MRILMLILDGLGDKPYPNLRNKTPLEFARTPNLDKMGHLGETGLMYTLGPGIIPGSDTAHLALFGYDPLEYYQGRGVYEALGAGIKLKPSDVAFRVNFATKKKGIIVDRRAGRNGYKLDELANELDGMKIGNAKILFKHTVEHRAVLVIRGKGLGKNVSDTDPHVTGKEIREPKPLTKSKSDKKTAEVLRRFLKEAERILKDSKVNRSRKRKGLPPANALLVRGAGQYKPVPGIKGRFGITATGIAGGALYKGVARFVGMDVPDIPGATGDKNTNLEAKAEAAINAKTDLVFLHVKATDSFSHDKDPKGKARFISKVDKELVSKVKSEFDLIFVSGDHSTFSSIGEHTADPLPILIYGDEDIIRQDLGAFGERKSALGQHKINGLDVMPILLSKAGFMEKFGE